MKIISYSINWQKDILTKVSLMLCLILISSTLYAQNQKISFSKKQMPLITAFSQIEAQTNLTVAYNESIINVNRVVSTDIQPCPLSEALTFILKGTGTSYKIQNDKILIVHQAAPVKNIKYSGSITDINKQPVIGATVLIQGTTKGTSTDAQGRFSLTAPQSGTLLISSIGMTTQQIKLGARTELMIIMAQDTKVMDEVVVVGYGVQNRRDVSTSIASVKSDQLANVPISDFRQALVGKMAGVQVMQPNGDPEGNISIRVRGVSSATAGNNPLYIIDGVPVERGMSNLNNNDIESVEVLKDASAAAIYGSRGSNGVVIITTKSGKTERLTVQYDGYYGVQNVSRKLPMMNAYQFADIAKDGHDNAYIDEVGGNASPNDPNGIRPKSYHKIPPELLPYLNGEKGLTDTDWQDEIFRSASTTSHNISISGKGKNVNFFVSGNYMLKEGIIINSDFQKYSMRMNLDGKYNKFKFGVNFSPSYSTSNRVQGSGAYASGGIVSSALVMPPLWPVYNQDGSYNYQGNGYWRRGTDYQHNEVLNPVALAMLQSDVVDRMSMVGKAFAEYEFFKGFSYNISVGGDFYGEHEDKYRSSELPLLGRKYFDAKSNPTGVSGSNFYFNWLVENKFSYNTTINGAHNINAILVQSAQKETYKGNGVTATDYPNDYIQTISGGTVSQGESDKRQWSLASYLARVQYSYKGKYMLSAAIRTDGSSRFGKNNRWGYFPSGSAAWRISDEPFFRDTKALGFVNDFKLRASYGVTGNFQIGNYEHLSTMALDNYVLGTLPGLVSGYKPDAIANDDLHWEKTAMVNAGFDVTMFNGLLGVSAEYYNSNTTDMLLNVPVPQITGYSTARLNLGKVNNQGFELQLSSQRTFSKDFSYSVSANFAANKNEVKALGPGNTPIIKSGSVAHGYYITKVGEPIGSYYLMVQDGIFSNEQQLKQYPHFDNTHPGDFRFVDVDGDGVMDLDKDRAIVGNYMPDFTYGLSGSVAFKGIDLGFNFQGVQGNEILYLNRRYMEGMEGNLNGSTLGLNRWKSPENPGNGQVNRANRKSKGYNGRISTWHVEDGSYLRLQNVSLGYTLPSKITKRFFVQKLRVYLSGENLCTWTNYTGYNPEVNARPDEALTPGEDYGTYPLARTFIFGLNITF